MFSLTISNSMGISHVSAEIPEGIMTMNITSYSDYLVSSSVHREDIIKEKHYPVTIKDYFRYPDKYRNAFLVFENVEVVYVEHLPDQSPMSDSSVLVDKDGNEFGVEVQTIVVKQDGFEDGALYLSMTSWTDNYVRYFEGDRVNIYVFTLDNSLKEEAAPNIEAPDFFEYVLLSVEDGVELVSHE